MRRRRSQTDENSETGLQKLSRYQRIVDWVFYRALFEIASIPAPEQFLNGSNAQSAAPQGFQKIIRNFDPTSQMADWAHKYFCRELFCLV